MGQGNKLTTDLK